MIEAVVRATALKALALLLEGTSLDAVRFRGAGFTLLFVPLRVDAGEVYLYLDSDWRIGAINPTAADISSLTASTMTPEQQLVALYGLHGTAIHSVMVGATQPDLTITFNDGRLLVVPGHHENYECWELGTAITEPTADFCVIALPNDRLMVIIPEGFV